MSVLFPSLSTVSNALAAFSQSLAAEQNNISNSSTPGYAAVRAVIQPLGIGAGGATDQVALRSTGNTQADALVQAASSQASDSRTRAQQLQTVNQQFDITGSAGILAALEQFSTAFSNLSVTPDDPSLQATALSAAGSVASAFSTAAQNLDSQSQSLQADAQATVSQINDLAVQIAKWNVQARGQAEANPAVAASQRSALTQLSSFIGITVTQNSDGTVNVLAGGTIPLVLGDTAFSLSANLPAATGGQVTSSGGGAAPPSFSGTLGGLLDTYNDTIAPILGGNGQSGALNTLALTFASSVNTLLSSGTTSSGTAGVPIFTYSSTASDVARTLAVDPSMTPAQLAVATTGASSQSNGVANQLAALSSSPNQVNGVSIRDYYGSIAQSVGQQLSDASAQSTEDQTSLTAAEANQTSSEGVSLDQEAINVTADQRAYEAVAKLSSVIDNITLDAVNLVGEQVS